MRDVFERELATLANDLQIAPEGHDRRVGHAAYLPAEPRRSKHEALQGCNPRVDRRYTPRVFAIPFALALRLLAGVPGPARARPPRRAAEPAVGGELQKGRVSSVHDADTITVRLSSGTENVRLVGIDSPELDDERPAYRTFGFAARDYARSRIDGATVTLEPDSKQADRDKFGRLAPLRHPRRWNQPERGARVGRATLACSTGSRST
jgi:hypothetical protein